MHFRQIAYIVTVSRETLVAYGLLDAVVLMVAEDRRTA